MIARRPEDRVHPRRDARPGARAAQCAASATAPPFTLTAWRDGELSLTDTATGRSIELTAFGSTNRAAFAALLETRS